MPNQLLSLKENLATLDREEAEARQRRNALANRPTNHDVISDQEMVDKIFGFLPSVIGGQEGQAPLGFEVQSCRLVMGHIHPLCKSIDCWNSISGQFCLMNFCTVKESPKLVKQTVSSGSAFRGQFPKVFDHVQFGDYVSSKATAHLFLWPSRPSPNSAILCILAPTTCSADSALNDFPAETSWKSTTQVIPCS